MYVQIVCKLSYHNVIKHIGNFIMINPSRTQTIFACAATWGSAPHPARGLRPLEKHPPPDFPIATPLLLTNKMGKIMLVELSQFLFLSFLSL